MTESLLILVVVLAGVVLIAGLVTGCERITGTRCEDWISDGNGRPLR